MLQVNQDRIWIVYGIFALFDVFVCLVLIPISYLLNDEAIKLLIAAKGWTTICRSQDQDY